MTAKCAGSPMRAIDAAGGDVLAQSAGVEGESLRGQLRDRFRSNQEDRLARSSMNFRVVVGVACDAQRTDIAFRDRSLGHASTGNADLYNGSGRHSTKLAA